jgi:malic enzyme
MSAMAGMSAPLKRNFKEDGRYATTARGVEVLETSLLNKGVAFTRQERLALGLEGLLPPAFLAALRSAVWVSGTRIRDQRVVVFGAGTAGVGIADQLRDAMVRDGADRDEATRRIWCVDKQGLLTDDMDDLRDFQVAYARPAAEVAGWRRDGSAGIRLPEVVAQVKPTMLLGTSTVHGAFTEDLVREMARHVQRPIIFPISNPTERIEAMPDQLIAWTDGRALITVGIPVPPVTYERVIYAIGQANNALVYPGLGLGTIVARARHVSDGMLVAAEAVAGLVDVSTPGASLLPQVENLRSTSATVAVAVAERAAKEGLAQAKLTDRCSRSRTPCGNRPTSPSGRRDGVGGARQRRYPSGRPSQPTPLTAAQERQRSHTSATR